MSERAGRSLRGATVVCADDGAGVLFDWDGWLCLESQVNRRTFIGSLAAVFLIPQSRPTFVSGSFGRLGKWFGDFKTERGL